VWTANQPAITGVAVWHKKVGDPRCTALTETEFVYCAVRTECLNNFQVNLSPLMCNYALRPGGVEGMELQFHAFIISGLRWRWAVIFMPSAVFFWE
jgi:hypothetical protein